MKDEYDFSKAKRVDPSRVDPDAVMIPISLKIHVNDVCTIRDEADRLSIPYLNLMVNVINQYARLS